MKEDILEYCQKHADLFRENLPKNYLNPGPNTYKTGFDNGYNLGAAQALEEIIREFGDD